MSGRDARADWRRFAAESIPTKTATPQLDAFLDACLAAGLPGRRPTLLDVGCGDGRIAHAMHRRGFAVTGIDVNEGAVAAGRQRAADDVDSSANGPRFLVADAAGDEPPLGLGDPFDVVVCQLVLSIVGGPADRGRLLRGCASLLRRGGRLFVSASGVSGDMNPAYARLYVDDEPLTGEPFTYFSRDADGRVLYATHHFTEPELASALAAAGLAEIAIEPVVEASSRRPQERAIFHYATASKPLDPAS